MPSHLRLLLVVMLTALTLGGAAMAQGPVSPRGAEHDDFGRMVFDWPGPVQWSATLADDKTLVVRFDKPLSGDPKGLLKALPRYLKAATLSADRRTATFDLVRPVQLKTFQSGTSTVVDLSESRSAPAKPAPPPAAAPAPATDVMVRGGEHTGFNRLVFDWPKPCLLYTSRRG